jgi:hypothetical protein
MNYESQKYNAMSNNKYNSYKSNNNADTNKYEDLIKVF